MWRHLKWENPVQKGREGRRATTRPRWVKFPPRAWRLGRWEPRGARGLGKNYLSVNPPNLNISHPGVGQRRKNPPASRCGPPQTRGPIRPPVVSKHRVPKVQPRPMEQ